LRVLSILEQAASTKKEREVFGSFYPLIELPTDDDLDVILDGAYRVLRAEGMDHYELQVIFNEWLRRRLVSSTPITPIQLISCLQNIRDRDDRSPEKVLTALRVLFKQEPSLFEQVFEHLANAVPNDDRSFRLFTIHDLWQLLPVTVW